MIVSSKSGPEYARCSICSRDIKVAASGVFDVRMHLGTSMHQSNEKASYITGVNGYTLFMVLSNGSEIADCNVVHRST